MSDVPSNMSDIMNTQQAARHHDVSERTILRWIKQGKLNAVQERGRWVIRHGGHDVRHDEQNVRHTAPPDVRHVGHEDMVQQLQAENAHLRELIRQNSDQLARRDEQAASLTEQIDHLTQLLAVQTKTNAALTDRLPVIEDMHNRRRPLWRRIFSRG